MGLRADLGETLEIQAERLKHKYSVDKKCKSAVTSE